MIAILKKRIVYYCFLSVGTGMMREKLRRKGGVVDFDRCTRYYIPEKTKKQKKGFLRTCDILLSITSYQVYTRYIAKHIPGRYMVRVTCTLSTVEQRTKKGHRRMFWTITSRTDLA